MTHTRTQNDEDVFFYLATEFQVCIHLLPLWSKTMDVTDFQRNCIRSVGEALSWDTLVNNHLLGMPTLCGSHSAMHEMIGLV
jgi:hypothetical protein